MGVISVGACAASMEGLRGRAVASWPEFATDTAIRQLAGDVIAGRVLQEYIPRRTLLPKHRYLICSKVISPTLLCANPSRCATLHGDAGPQLRTTTYTDSSRGPSHPPVVRVSLYRRRIKCSLNCRVTLIVSLRHFERPSYQLISVVPGSRALCWRLRLSKRNSWPSKLFGCASAVDSVLLVLFRCYWTYITRKLHIHTYNICEVFLS